MVVELKQLANTGYDWCKPSDNQYFFTNQEQQA
jgi:hypothetical protein